MILLGDKTPTGDARAEGLPFQTMPRRFHQVSLDLLPERLIGGRMDTRPRADAIPAQLTDLYRERVPVAVVKTSGSGMGVKADERFAINFPVLIECVGLIIMGPVRHCMKAAKGGYVLG